jgi:hypothetical protein
MPNRQAGARSFQLGRASAPIAPHTVQTTRPERRHRYIIGKGIRVQHRLVIAPHRAAGDRQRPHTVFAHAAKGHH